MDIERMSMNLSQTQLMDAVGTKVLSMSLDRMEQGVEDMVAMLDESITETTVNSDIGGNLDIMV